jgi:uncharacterized protein YbbC (DUF1343 family)/CubicO group peptidase (beta-lactamase class C family)
MVAIRRFIATLQSRVVAAGFSLRQTTQAKACGYGSSPVTERFRFLLFFFFIDLVAASFSFAHAADPSPHLRKEQLAPISAIVKKEIRRGNIPGAVVIIGTPEKILYRRAFGSRALKPHKLPMKIETIFDLASLTKVVATTTAVMKLSENGELNVDDAVFRYWPEFKSSGKEDITVRDLLTHYSGLKPDIPLDSGWSGYEAALEKVIDEKPISPPGMRFLYSDINFIALGEIVRRVSGKPLNIYCDEQIFKPIGMKNTCFSPPRSLQSCIAPTQYRRGRRGEMLCGVVHDPTTQKMGGVAGHAGLFSTADDLSLFARMLLSGGSIRKVGGLHPETIEKMTLPQSPSGKAPLRGFGWNIDAPLVSNRGALQPIGSYGHKGFTGTFLWIDPVSNIYIIILTNRVHPYGKGDAEPLRNEIMTVVSKAVGSLSEKQITARRPSLAVYYNRINGDGAKNRETKRVELGIDVLAKEGFRQLRGLRIGVITNHSGISSSGSRTIDLLSNAPGVKLKAIFSPEHGLSGNADDRVPSTKDPLSGMPVYSLYGDTLKPTEKMLDGIDALIFDIQDIGVRFYTYITTMGYALEAAAGKSIPFYVLDRPNPLTSSSVQGPVMEKDMRSFTGYFPLPVRYGMTVGEMAEMYNKENDIGADLRVIKMIGYKRNFWFDETGLQWVKPSPNIRSLNEAVLYPGVALIEGANVSVGRGTETPFEIFGAPWIHAKKLAEYLTKRQIKGIRFVPADFSPKSSPYKNRQCHGVRIILSDRNALDSPALGIEIASALHRLYPKDFQIDKTLPLIGSRKVLQSVKDGLDPRTIVKEWQEALDRFNKMRANYFLY